MTTAMMKRHNGEQSASLGNVVDNIFQNSIRRFFDDNFWEAGNGLSAGSVPVNVREVDNNYEMDIIAPGCRKDAFKIQVADNVLTVSMDHQEEKKDDNKKGWTRNEWVHRSFSRSFTLDDTVDVTNINANYQDGVLKLVLPKKPEAQKLTKTIEVK